jgi:hypothetical protein
MQKNEVYRNPKFLNFCHQHHQGLCVLCGKNRWQDLHHFGNDGGMGMKPNDLEVARLCKYCHEKFGHKRMSLVKRNQTEVLLAFERDAGVLARAWIQWTEQHDRTRGKHAK